MLHRLSLKGHADNALDIHAELSAKVVQVLSYLDQTHETKGKNMMESSEQNNLLYTEIEQNPE